MTRSLSRKASAKEEMPGAMQCYGMRAASAGMVATEGDAQNFLPHDLVVSSRCPFLQQLSWRFQIAIPCHWRRAFMNGPTRYGQGATTQAVPAMRTPKQHRCYPWRVASRITEEVQWRSALSLPAGCLVNLEGKDFSEPL